MALVVPFAGLLLTPFVSVIVYVDAGRRGYSQSKRLFWAGWVGVVSFGGFLFPFVLDGAIARAYLQLVKPAPVVTSPFEMLVLHVAVGLAVSALTLVVYGLDRRYGPFEAA